MHYSKPICNLEIQNRNSCINRHKCTSRSKNKSKGVLMLPLATTSGSSTQSSRERKPHVCSMNLEPDASGGLEECDEGVVW